MRSTLLRSVFVVFTFWWVATTVFFSLSSPEFNKEALTRIAELIPWLEVEIPEQVSALNAFLVQFEVAQYWIMPMWMLITGLAITGYTVAWLVAVIFSQKRKQREQGKGNWREMAVTLGVLPMPENLDKADIALKPKGKIAEAIKQMAPEHERLFNDIIATIAAYPKAYSGDGHGVTLLQHTLNVINRALEETEDPDPLLLVATAAHDIGKITAFKEIGDEFVAVKHHDKESAHLLCRMGGWWALDPIEREILRLSVKYSHSPSKMPLGFEAEERTRKLIDQLRGADGMATKEEKKAVLKKGDLPDMAVDALLHVLPKLAFQVEGLPKKIRASGWKKENRIYLLEIGVREAALDALDPDTRSALGGKHRDDFQVAPFTKALLQGLDKRGWLVKKIGKAKSETERALWKISAGIIKFQGVIVIDMPEEHMSKLPEKDSVYEVNVISEQWPSPSQMSAEGMDLSNLLAPPKPSKASDS